MNDGDYPADPSSSDPQKRLARDARKRIVRAIVKADKFMWDAEASIQAHKLDQLGMSAQIERSNAAFEKARVILGVLQIEYGKVVRGEQEYRDWIDNEIEALGNSLQLSMAQRRSLKSEFFFPIDAPLPEAQPRPSSQVSRTHEPRQPGADTAFRRAAWVKDRLIERKWDHNRPQEFGGPDRKTMKKLLAGLPVHDGTLDKLIVALNKLPRGKTLAPADIPND
jgi:hypothetical protein